MSDVLLQKGDIIRLEKGMKIYATIPTKYHSVWEPFSNGSKEANICIGDILYKKLPDKAKIIEELKKTFSIHVRYQITDEQAWNFIESLGLDFSAEEFDTSVFTGEYHVCQCFWDGGDCSRYLCGRNYSQGWHVFCEKVDNPQTTIHFFQDDGLCGDYYAKIYGIKPIRHEP